MDEFAAIARYFRPLTEGRPEALNLLDDAARIAVPSGYELVITSDALQEGIHFFGNESPAHIAQKSLRVNLSDIAAKGASPYAYFLTLGIPPRHGENWLARFVEGLRHDQSRFGIFLAGGDTTRSTTQLTISITALGLVPKGAMRLRSGARAGEGVYVTGTIGDSALGLSVLNGASSHLSSPQKVFLTQRYFLPEPRTALAEALRTYATSAMDISDGLVQDAAKLCAASALSCDIAMQHIPLSPAATAWLKDGGAMEMLLTGGDDYEILFTAPVAHEAALNQVSHATQIPITRLGVMQEGGGGVRILDAAGAPMQFIRKGWSHTIG